MTFTFHLIEVVVKIKSVFDEDMRKEITTVDEPAAVALP